MVETAGKKLLFDPFINGNPLVKDFDINTIQADYIFASHGHGDHIGDLVAIAQNTGATVVGVLEVMNWVVANGYDKVSAMNYGRTQMEFGEVRMVPAAHSSSLPDGSYGGNPGGFIITTKDDCFYYTGDTCLTMEMQLVPKYANPYVAIMPIGGHFTMDAEDALMASDFIKCDKVVGVHFNTWPPITIDGVLAKKKFAAAGKELILPVIGETIEL
jgi:L-ascorbate metabolism protein UlaG (beta-lactamase superfamily)